MDGMTAFPDKFFDLAVVDPPYFAEANLHYHNGAMLSTTKIKRRQYHRSQTWNVPDNAYYEELLRVSKEQIIFGINYFSFVGVPPGRIVWDKQRSGLITSFSDGEIASCSLIKGVRIFRYRWDGMLQGNMKNKEHKFHITQKPVPLYTWIYQNYAKPGDKILDTHAGSASSFVAAYNMGFDYVGFEIDPEYHKQAQARVDGVMAQVRLF
jgi:site-specific DNA-methyltransferase (adenine-specific)